MLEWVKNLRKIYKGVFIFWKYINQSFPMVGDIISWKVGDGSRTFIGIDSIMGSSLMAILYRFLVRNINNIGVTTLTNVAVLNGMPSMI